VITDALPDIPRHLTAIAEWGACVLYIVVLVKGFTWRLAVGLPLGLALLLGVQWVNGQLPIALWAPGMIVAIAVMFGLLWFTLRQSVLSTMFLAARALILAEFVASLQWQLRSFFEPALIVEVASVVIVFGGLFVLAGVAEARHMTRGVPLETTRRDLLTSAFIAAATFFVSNISFIIPNTPFSGRLGLEVFYIRTLVDLCGFIGLYAQQEQRMQLQARTENAAVNSLLRSQHEQYLQSKRTTEQVNRKYHDMRNQIEVIRSEADPQRKAAYLDELEESISAFAQQRHTGSSVLDTLLAAKGAYATEHGVQLNVVADGALLDFIGVIDLTSIFGNALDNAIESSMRVTDPDNRLVRVAVFARGELLMIRVENSFDGRLRMVEGRPQTLKSNRTRHGYGLKNIESAAERYGGTMTIEATDSWFSLRILVPLASGS
jgi:sensor histidine kinase YesM